MATRRSSKPTQQATIFRAYAFQFLSFFSTQPNPVAVAEDVVDVFLEKKHPLRCRPCVENDGDDPRIRLRLFAARRDDFEECLGVGSAHGQLAENVWRLLHALDLEERASPIRRALDAVAAAGWRPMENIEDAKLRRWLETLGRAVQFSLAGFTGHEKVLRKRLEAEHHQLEDSDAKGKDISHAADRLLRAFYTGSVENGVREFHRLHDLCDDDRANIPKSTGNKAMRALRERGWVVPSDAGGQATMWQLTVDGLRELQIRRREPVSLPRPKQDAGMRGSKKRPRSKGLR